MIALTELASRLENLAEWRRELADDHPDDLRHGAAAEMFRHFAAQLPFLEGAAAHRKLVASWERVAGSALLTKAENELARAIGFSVFPDTPADFLHVLVERLEQGVAAAN